MQGSDYRFSFSPSNFAHYINHLFEWLPSIFCTFHLLAECCWWDEWLWGQYHWKFLHLFIQLHGHVSVSFFRIRAPAGLNEYSDRPGCCRTCLLEALLSVSAKSLPIQCLYCAQPWAGLGWFFKPTHSERERSTKGSLCRRVQSKFTQTIGSEGLGCALIVRNVPGEVIAKGNWLFWDGRWTFFGDVILQQ